MPPPTHAALLPQAPWLGSTTRSCPFRSTTTRGLRSSSGPELLPSTDVRWLRRSSFRQSDAVYHLPRSNRTTLSPPAASCWAATPPPAPAPHQEDEPQSPRRQLLGRDASPGARPDDHRIHMFECHRSGPLPGKLVAIAPPDGDHRHP